SWSRLSTALLAHGCALSKSRYAPRGPSSSTSPTRARESPSTAMPRAGLTRSERLNCRSQRLSPAELVELLVVDAEEVGDLVHDGDRDFLDDVFARVADLEGGIAEDQDPVGQLTPAPVATLGEGDAVVVAEQRRVIRR